MNRRNPTKKFLSLFSSLCLVALLLSSSLPMAAQAAAEVDLWIELKAPDHVAPDSNVVINLSYSNKGTAASSEITIQVTLPEGLTFLSAVDKEGETLPPFSIVDKLITWKVPGLPLDSAWQHIWITAHVDADLDEAFLLETTATINSESVESNLDNNVATISSQVCDMAGSKKEADVEQAKPGDVVTYTITLSIETRQTQETMRERVVTLTDFLPPANQARFMGWDIQPPGASFDEQQQQLRWQGTVCMGEPVTLRYRLGIEGDFPPGEVLRNRASLQWSGGGMDLEPVDIPIELTDDDHMFGPGGGEWQHAWGLTLTVPPHGVQEMTRFQFRPLSETPMETPPGWMFAGCAFELSAFQYGEIHQFNQPIEITIRYNQGEVRGIYRQSLQLWYRAGPGEPWVQLDKPLQHREGEITFSTDHFTEFALFGRPGFNMMIPIVVRR